MPVVTGSDMAQTLFKRREISYTKESHYVKRSYLRGQRHAHRPLIMRKSNKPLQPELQACPVARTLEIVGEKWTTLILRDLFLRGTVRFQELQTSLSGLSPATLSARLKSLEAQGIIEQRFYSDHPPRAEYFLTDKGKSLGPILKALRDWGTQYG